MTPEQWEELRELVEGHTPEVALREGMTKEEANGYWARFMYQSRNQARAELATANAELARLTGDGAALREQLAAGLERERLLRAYAMALRGDLVAVMETEDYMYGDAHMQGTLDEDVAALAVDAAAKCPDCSGFGGRNSYPRPDYRVTWYACKACNGTGRIDPANVAPAAVEES